MKIVFMGTPDFAVETLNEIVNAGHEVALVVTQPDKPKGRGNKMQFPPVKERALELELPVEQPVKVKDEEFVKKLEEMNPDIIVVVAFGQILSERILNLPKYGCINVHASLLPHLRGAAPIQWSVIDGDKESGVTIQYMAKGIDTGDVIAKTVVPLDAKETGGSLHDKLMIAGAKLLAETLPKIEQGDIVREKQDDSKSSYAKMLDKKLGKLDFHTQTAEEMERLIRGLNPWPSAYISLDGKTLKIWSADVIKEELPGEVGTVVKVVKDGFYIKTKEGCLNVKELQLEGKKRMDTKSFLLGYEIIPGTKIG
ncbi:MAG: methionyl-tRNA formyltransferase [Lachnospiraceae bacterium]|nr:methionyl-tRNA formyltransferase [Lachnospiraceae bacterium]